MYVPDSAVRDFVNRGYREGAPFQWVRELYKNSEEAGATRIEFGIERQAAANLGVFRRIEVENGHGMDNEHLLGYFKMLGVGGKPVGGPHENFGIGARVSLLPWNTYGVVVISRRNGEDSMIWLRRDRDGDYGLREWEDEEEDGTPLLTQWVEPYDDPEHGCDWSRILPDWVGDHGTAIVLLGNDPTQNTIDGDPRFPEEAAARGIDKYLSSRLWTVNDSISLTVVAKEDLTDRATSRRETRDMILGKLGNMLIGGHRRRVFGLESLLTEDAVTGSVQVDGGGTQIFYALRNEDAPHVADRLPTAQTFIALEYDGELYEHKTHSANFRMFGVAHEAVRKRLWLIVKPPEYDPVTGLGVYPNQARSKLFWRGNGPPLSEWAHHFANHLPPAIQEALSKAYASDTTETSTLEEDEERRKRLVARFGSRWRQVRYVLSSVGVSKVDPTEANSPRAPHGRRRRRPVPPNPRVHTGGSSNEGPAALGTLNAEGTELAVERPVGVDLPEGAWVQASAMGDEKWSAARWVYSRGPKGTVELNQDHPLFATEIRYWQTTRANHLADQVRHVVMEVYKDLAIAHVAHVRNYAGMRISDTFVDGDRVADMLSPAALTCALSGLLGAEAMIQTRLGGRFGRAA